MWMFQSVEPSVGLCQARIYGLTQILFFTSANIWRLSNSPRPTPGKLVFNINRFNSFLLLFFFFFLNLDTKTNKEKSLFFLFFSQRSILPHFLWGCRHEHMEETEVAVVNSVCFYLPRNGDWAGESRIQWFWQQTRQSALKPPQILLPTSPNF